jgi:hypothetical protein
MSQLITRLRSILVIHNVYFTFLNTLNVMTSSIPSISLCRVTLLENPTYYVSFGIEKDINFVPIRQVFLLKPV